MNTRPLVWFGVMAALLAVQISPWWYPAPDAVLYLSTARSLAHDHQLAALGNPQLGYPPGYPLLISPAFWLDAPPFLAVACIHWILAVVLMVGVYRWAGRQCPGAALLVTGLVMVNVSVWILYRRALSELAFMAVLVWAGQLLNAVLARTAPAAVLATSLAAGVVLAALCMIREVGIVVGAGFVCAAAVAVWNGRLDGKTALLRTVLVTFPPLAAVLAFVRYETAMRAASPAPLGTHADGLAYVTHSLAAQLIEGLRLRISEVGRLLIPGMFKSYAGAGDWIDINIALYVPLFVLVAAGWYTLARRRTDVLVLTLPFYVLTYVVWSFDSATRYLTPMLPVLVASLWWVLEPVPRYRQTLFPCLLIAHLGVAVGFWVFVEVPRAQTCTRQWDALTALGQRIPPAARGSGAALLPQCEGLLLELILNRQVAASVSVPGQPGPQWVAVTDGAPVPPGFHLAAESAPYRLFVAGDGASAAH